MCWGSATRSSLPCDILQAGGRGRTTMLVLALQHVGSCLLLGADTAAYAKYVC
jgi:hypothetical protein